MQLRAIFAQAVLIWTCCGVGFLAAEPAACPVEKACRAAEEFIWSKVCSGEPADLNSMDGETFVDAKAGDLPGRRIVRVGLLKSMIGPTPCSVSIGGGINIAGARFDEEIDLTAKTLDHDLTISNSRLNAGLNFYRLVSNGNIQLRDSWARYLKMEELSVENLLLTGLHVDSILYDKPVSIDLTDAHIKKAFQLDAASSVVGEVRAEGIEVGRDAYLNRGAEFNGQIDMRRARIANSLYLSGGVFHDVVDLTGAQIGAGLMLNVAEDGDTKWLLVDTENLVLRNARADTIPLLTEPWPPKADLTGFLYRALEKSDAGAGGGNVSRQISHDDLQSWFGRQDYSLQPYEQLAQVFQNSGAPETAAAVRYAAREKQRELSSGVQYAWLTALDWLIGYGYYPEQAILWVVLLVLVGAIVASRQAQVNGLPRFPLAYSFDMLLPAIKLRETHYKIDLKGGAGYYFYFHRIAGWLLALFLVAGISGLTK